MVAVQFSCIVYLWFTITRVRGEAETLRTERDQYRSLAADAAKSYFIPEPPAPEERIARLAEDYLSGLIKLITDREQHHQKVMDGLLDRIQDPSLPARKALRESADEVLDMGLRDVDEAWLKQPGSEMDFDPDLDPRFGYVDTE